MGKKDVGVDGERSTLHVGSGVMQRIVFRVWGGYTLVLLYHTLKEEVKRVSSDRDKGHVVGELWIVDCGPRQWDECFFTWEPKASE